jgi:protein-tyrosine phosphatase
VFGPEVARLSEWMIRSRLVHVLASDSHNLRGRPPILSRALEAMVPWAGEEMARRMVTDIPRALLAGQSPDVPPPEESEPRRRSFLSRWLGGG